MTALAKTFYITGGTLPTSATSYVVRQADTDLFENLRHGEFCYVLNTRQIGKSSLMIRTAQRLREHGIAVGVLDLTAIGQNLEPKQWYIGLLILLGEQLGLEDELSDFWMDNPQLGPMQRFFAAIHQVALPRLDPARSPTGRLILFVDEIDVVRSLPFSADEFFAGIRECYNRRTQDPEYERLTFCLLGVATPADLIQDTRTSPFNIGKRIELRDFTPEEAAPLAEGLSSGTPNTQHLTPHGQRLLRRVLYWTGGHPYMTQRLCRVVSEAGAQTNPSRSLSRREVDRLCHALFLSKGARESDDNLAFVRNRLLRSEVDLSDLLDLYTQIRNGKRTRDDETDARCGVLRLSGAVRSVDGILMSRNRVYARVFDKGWVASHLPDAELLRQRAAFRRGVARTAAVSGVLMTSVLALSFVALQQKLHSDVSAAQARQEMARANRERTAATLLAEQLRGALEASRRDKRAAERSAAAAKTAALAEKKSAEKARLASAEAQASAQSAHQQAQRAERATSASQRSRYIAQTALAFRAAQDNNLGRVRELTEALRPAPGEADIRGFEWRALWRRYNAALVQPKAQSVSLGVLKGHKQGVVWMALSPDEKLLATCSLDSSIKLWDWRKGKEIASFSDPKNGHKLWVTSIDYSPDGKYLVTTGMGFPGQSSSAPPKVILWDVAKRKIARAITGSGDNHTISAAFSPDGKRIAVGTAWGFVNLWEQGQYRSLGRLGDYVLGVAWSRDGRWLASACANGKLTLWDMQTLKEAKTVQAHKGPAGRPAFSPDGSLLASCGQDGKIVLWSVPDLAAQGTIEASKNQMASVMFSPDGETLASGSFDQTVRLWDVATRQQKALFTGHTERAGCVLFTQDGKTLLSGGLDKVVRIWNPTALPVTDTLRGSGGRIHDLAFSPDSRVLVTANDDSTGQRRYGRVWDATNGQIARNLRETTKGMGSGVCYHPTEPLVIFMSGAHLSFWQAGSWRERDVIRMPANIEKMALSPDGSTLALACEDRKIRLWNVKARRETGFLLGVQGQVSCLAFSPNGKRAFAGTRNGRVLWWDVGTRRLVTELTTGHGMVFHLAVSPDGKTLATGGNDIAIRLWDIATGRDTGASLLGHTSFVTTVAFSPDGRTLASGSGDKTVRLWNMATRQEVASFEDFTESVWQVAFSPDGNLLAAGSWDGTVRLYRATPFSLTDRNPVAPRVAARSR